MSYSVLYEPVIPVRMPDGETGSLGIREILLRSHEISDLNAETPLEQFALIRLLCAFVMEIFHPNTEEGRKALLNEGKFDPEKTDAYFAMCERNSPRFDLFDEYHPFLQSTFDFNLDAASQKPVSKLSIFLPSGNNHMFLDHRMENEPVMTPAEAFRSLICTSLFCTAGAQGFPSGVNNTTPVYSWMGGENLHTILVLNSLSVEECRPVPYGLGEVPWRNEDTVIPKQTVEEMSLLQALTWQPRRVILIRDEDGLVRRMIFRQGKNFQGNELWRDPFTAFKKNAQKEWKQILPLHGRSLWLDLGYFLPDSSGEVCIPPAVFLRSGEIRNSQEGSLELHQVGLVTSQASFGEWSEDTFRLPCFLASDPEYAGILRTDLESIDRLQNVLGIAVKNCFRHSPATGLFKEASLADQAQKYFLDRMHCALTECLIPDLKNRYPDHSREGEAAHIRMFQGKLQDALLSSIEEMIDGSGSTAEKIRAQTEVKRILLFSFQKICKERTASYEQGKMEN